MKTNPTTTTPSAPTVDQMGRPLQDLRISLTDRCNFRCRYCMPREQFGPYHTFLSEEESLSIDEILRVTKSLVQLGVQKVRLTGGEPLLRRDLAAIIEGIVALGVEDIALTTNGSLLTKKRAQDLRRVGLKRINVSLDAMDDEVFKRVNDVGFPVRRVLEAIDNAIEAGLSPIKVNMVVRRRWNDQEIMPMVEYFRHRGVILRFIEYMDVGNTNGWSLADVVPSSEILDQINAKYPLIPLQPTTHGEVATRYAYEDGGGEIGFIHSVSEPFCTGCTRLRLTSSGELFTCLFANKGLPLLSDLRNGITDDELVNKIASRWRGRSDRYSMLRTEETANLPRVEMSRIGG